MFEINQNVKKYVEAKDVEGVRLTLTGIERLNGIGEIQRKRI